LHHPILPSPSSLRAKKRGPKNNFQTIQRFTQAPREIVHCGLIHTAHQALTIATRKPAWSHGLYFKPLINIV
jgi:hypothetical protein